MENKGISKLLVSGAAVLALCLCGIVTVRGANYTQNSFVHLVHSLIDSTPIGATTPSTVNATAYFLNGNPFLGPQQYQVPGGGLGDYGQVAFDTNTVVPTGHAVACVRNGPGFAAAMFVVASCYVDPGTSHLIISVTNNGGGGGHSYPAFEMDYTVF